MLSSSIKLALPSPLQAGSSMDFEPQEFDWPCFWVMEVIFLSAPSLITVIYFRSDGYLQPRTVGLLAIVLVGLTVLNGIVFKAKAAFANRSHSESDVRG